MTDVIPRQSEWRIIDSTKLGTYMQCPRKYFYAYLLGWQPREPNIHLVFGTAWHLAAEHLLKTQYDEKEVEEAQFKFFNYFRDHFDSSRDRDFEPKTLANALESIKTYAKRFKSDVVNYQVLGTEIAGRVMIGPKHPMAFRIDAVLEELQYSLGEIHKVIVLDHKTSQRRMYYWKDEWKMSIQILLYIYVAMCIHGMSPDLEIGARVRGAFFYKAKNTEYEEAPVDRTPNQMQAWLTSIRAHYDLLMSDMRILLSEDKVGNDEMEAFPMNEKSCFLYSRPCEYFDFCSADGWANPLQKCDRTPKAFVVRQWNPLADPNIEHKIDLVQLEVSSEKGTDQETLP
jgi:hypothetical protein